MIEHKPWECDYVVHALVKQDFIKQWPILAFNNQMIPEWNKVFFEVLEFFLSRTLIIFNFPLEVNQQAREYLENFKWSKM